MKKLALWILGFLLYATGHSQTVFRAMDMANAVCVNTHFDTGSYPNLIYTNQYPALLDALHNLGVTCIRDGLPGAATGAGAILNEAGSMGIQTEFILGGSVTSPQNATTAATYMNNIYGFEPLNEQSFTGAAASLAFFNYLNELPNLIPSGYPLFSPSFASNSNAQLSNGGYLYTVAPNITVAAQTGVTTTAAFSAQICSAAPSALNYVCGCTVTNPGAGYTSLPALTVVSAVSNPYADGNYNNGATVVATGLSGGTIGGCQVQQLAVTGIPFTGQNLHIYWQANMPENTGYGAADYEGNGYGSLAWNYDQMRITDPTLPVIVTETGWATDTPLDTSLPEKFLVAYQLRNQMNLFTVGGVNKIFTYELVDTGGNYFAAQASGTNLTVTTLFGFIIPGCTLSGTGVPSGTTILKQTSGTPGISGVYVTSQATTATSGTAIYCSFPTYSTQAQSAVAEHNWGLLRNDLSPKPSFYALENFINILADPGPTFTTTPLTVNLTGTTANVHTALFQKRNGTYEMAIWQAVSTWNQNGTCTGYTFGCPITITPQTVTATISGGPKVNTTYVFDNGGGVTTTAVTPAAAWTGSITEIPMFIQIH